MGLLSLNGVTEDREIKALLNVKFFNGTTDKDLERSIG